MGFVEESEYKGNALLVLKNTEEDRYPFSFGFKKAKLIIEHFEDVKKFVEKCEKAQKEKEAAQG